ncbi:MAG TPA: 5-methyltetrahydropteroyltriglutamate--homocysteine S-methyltransferase [Thermoanaerobaculia bacterium]|nr:5-methyltetrahydropteroyltriglutamate--homocysteine S-methyltransferase [Thermoanaerobaculia bacterium]
MTSSITGPPFRADHVGSLLRPPELREAHRAWSENRLSDDELEAIQDRAIRDAVALQEDAGLEAITDGEFRRASYWSRFVDRVDGMTAEPARFTFHDESGAEQAFLAPHAGGRLARRGPISGTELDFLARATRHTAKITLPSPPTMHFWRGAAGIDPRAYPDPEAFFADLVAVYREEIADLGARGARYLQLDEVPLAMLCDPDVRERLRVEGEDPERLVDRYLDLIRDAVAGAPPSVVFAMHLCRGNYKGRWLSEGGYEPIAERLFSEAPVDAFLLEFDTARAGGFAPLRFLPAGKRAMLGLVSTKTPRLESADELARLIDRAAEHAPLDRLGICPQCGFASTVGGNPLTADDQRRKLALVVEVARRVWDDP